MNRKDRTEVVDYESLLEHVKNTVLQGVFQGAKIKDTVFYISPDGKWYQQEVTDTSSSPVPEEAKELLRISRDYILGSSSIRRKYRTMVEALSSAAEEDSDSFFFNYESTSESILQKLRRLYLQSGQPGLEQEYPDYDWGTLFYQMTSDAVTRLNVSLDQSGYDFDYPAYWFFERNMLQAPQTPAEPESPEPDEFGWDEDSDSDEDEDFSLEDLDLGAWDDYLN